MRFIASRYSTVRVPYGKTPTTFTSIRSSPGLRPELVLMLVNAIPVYASLRMWSRLGHDHGQLFNKLCGLLRCLVWNQHLQLPGKQGCPMSRGGGGDGGGGGGFWIIHLEHHRVQIGKSRAAWISVRLYELLKSNKSINYNLVISQCLICSARNAIYLIIMR